MNLIYVLNQTSVCEQPVWLNQISAVLQNVNNHMLHLKQLYILVNTFPSSGVLAQESFKGSPAATYIPSPYVKWLESAGARVIPVRLFRWENPKKSTLENIQQAALRSAASHHVCQFKAFLAHLSWKLKWAFLIACCLSVRLSVCPSVRL